MAGDLDVHSAHRLAEALLQPHLVTSHDELVAGADFRQTLAQGESVAGVLQREMLIRSSHETLVGVDRDGHSAQLIEAGKERATHSRALSRHDFLDLFGSLFGSVRTASNFASRRARLVTFLISSLADPLAVAASSVDFPTLTVKFLLMGYGSPCVLMFMGDG